MKKPSTTKISHTAKAHLNRESEAKDKGFSLEDPEITDIKKSKAPLYVSLCIVAGLVAAYFLVPGVQEFLKEAWEVLTSDDEQRIRQWVSEFGWKGPFIIILAMIAQMFLLVIPTPLLMIVSILAFGPVWGSLIILAAVFCASSVGYMLGAYFGPPVVEKILGPKGEKQVESFIEDYGFWAVIVTRLAPFL
ncbi:MAG: VTT domain-containing protein, partial [Bacteroidetes bacterium]|nr:VTT domain-containing protein [Bacteroidota bacterium]